MKDEIKEILEDIKDMNKYSNFIDSQYGGKNYYYLLEKEESKKLLDYITNLQEELKEYKMIFDTFSERPYAHKYLEEKKKELGNNKIIGLDSEMIYKDYYDLKSRSEKAIEYIKIEEKANPDSNRKDIGLILMNYKRVLNILQGEDKVE